MSLSGTGLQPSGQRLHCLDNYTQQLSSRASSHWPWPAASSPKTHLQKLHVQGINFSITLLIHRVRGLLLLFGGNQHVVVIIHSKALLIKRCNGERERCQIKQQQHHGWAEAAGSQHCLFPQDERALPLQDKKTFARNCASWSGPRILSYLPLLPIFFLIWISS